MASIRRPRQFLLEIHDLFDLHQKPPVNLREVENLFDGEAGAEGVADEEDAFGVGHAEFAADDVARKDVAVAIDFRADAPGFAVAAQTAAANLQRAMGSARAPACIGQRPAERIRRRAKMVSTRSSKPTRVARVLPFHLRGERGVGLREFLKREARNLGDDVINGRLEAGGSFARDVVFDFVEQVADGEFGN